MIAGILAVIAWPFIYIIWSRHRAYRLLIDSGYPIVESQHWFRGNLEFFLSPTAIFDYGHLAQSYGSTYATMHGGVPAIVTSDVDLIHSISQTHFDHFHGKMSNPLDDDPVVSSAVHMFAARGERWKRMRAITSQAISAQNMKQLYPIIEESIVSFIEYINELTTIGESMNIHKVFQNHTSDVLARCAFGQTYSMHKDNIYLKIFSKAFGNVPQVKAFCFESLSWCLPVISAVFRQMSKFLGLLRTVLHEFESPLMQYTKLLNSYRETRVAGAKKPDFLQYFKNSEDSTYSGYLSEQTSGVVDVSQLKLQKKMTSGEIVAQCRFISIAGFDTTANTLALLVDLLAKNPKQLAELTTEIENTENFDYDSILSMSTLHNCIFETLRIYPHASPLQHRQCMSDIQINNHLIKAGVAVIVDPWTVHHSKSVWGPDVECFRPERFNRLTDSQRRSFMPFGVGPRQCIGMRFALLEIKATVCYLLKHFQIEPKNSNEKLRMTLRDTGTVWPENVMITLTKRSD